MAVSPDDLKDENGGHIVPSVFDFLSNLDSQLTAWINAAPSNASDEAKKAYAYWRAFDRKAQEEADVPANESADGAMSMQTTDTQRATWSDKAAGWKAEFERLTGETGGTPPVRSQSVSSATSWV